MTQTLPDVVTFWYGRLDPTRQLCLASQVAAGHRVTVYSFGDIPGLPKSIIKADAGAILPHSFAERLRPLEPDGSWRNRTMLQYSDFFRMRLMEQRLGLWVDADVLLLKPIMIDTAKPYFAWEDPYRLGNSVLYLPPDDPIVRAFIDLMAQETLTPDWLSRRHRLLYQFRKLLRPSLTVQDFRYALYGPPSLTALAKRHDALRHALPSKSFYSIHRARDLFYLPSDFSALISDPGILGFHLSPKNHVHRPPAPGSLYAWASEQVEQKLRERTG